MKHYSQRYIYERHQNTWMVHIPSIRIRTKSFLFKKYNGKEEAFKAAVRWRDNECKKLNIIINNHSQSFGKCKGKMQKDITLRKIKKKIQLHGMHMLFSIKS